MADVLDFLPLFQESAASVRLRLDADANAQLTLDDVRWVDTREGTFYWDVTQVVLLELVRLWDALAVEVPAAASPLFAWGQYLERHAEVFGLTRKPAVQAGGNVIFVGQPGITVPTGAVVSADSATEDSDAIEFVTTEPGTTSAQVAKPAAPTLAAFNTGGTLPSATYYYRVTAISEFGETDGSTVASVALTGPSGRVTLDWADVAGAIGYRAYRSTSATADGVRVYDGPASAATDTGAAATIPGPPDQNLTAGAYIEVEAIEPGVTGNVAAFAISSLDSPIPEIENVFNPLPTFGGIDEESDGALRDRVLAEFQGRGGGNINDYRRWALAWPGVGRVFVNPTWNGPGTVQVVIMAENGDPVDQQTVDDLQADLDPVPGQGHGTAPIGATVTVQTPAVQTIAVAATLTLKTGYGLDGSGGSIAVREEIVKALADYIDALEVGEDVIYEHVKAQFFQAEGVYNISGVTVNGGTANVAITDDPPVIAALTTVTLA